MNSRTLLSLAIVLLGAVAAFLPTKKNNSAKLSATEMMRELELETFRISTDELANSLINADPSIMLIDLRDAAVYEKNPLPGALNIPFDSIMSENWLPYFDQVRTRKNILYSDTDAKALEAWMLVRQKGMKNNYVLTGGVETWEKTIIKPELPKTSEPEEAFALYQKRLAASAFFTGKGLDSGSSKLKVKKMPIKRRKKKAVEGGCS